MEPMSEGRTARRSPRRSVSKAFLRVFSALVAGAPSPLVGRISGTVPRPVGGSPFSSGASRRQQSAWVIRSSSTYEHAKRAYWSFLR